jgi:hypothetical protein
MARLYEIPILSRGRVIPPTDDDCVEFSGRAGARFRCPNPHKHIHDLVLGDAGRLQDLHDLPIAKVLDFLSALGPRLKLADNPYLQESYDLALEAGGLTKPLMTRLYDSLPAMFNRAKMEARVEATIGSRYLIPGCRRAPRVPPLPSASARWARGNCTSPRATSPSSRPRPSSAAR